MANAEWQNTNDTVRRGVWNRNTDRKRYCQNPDCGNEHVDPVFARTMGTEDGIVFACPDCTRWAALKRGAAADPTIQHRVDREWH